MLPTTFINKPTPDFSQTNSSLDVVTSRVSLLPTSVRGEINLCCWKQQENTTGACAKIALLAISQGMALSALMRYTISDNLNYDLFNQNSQYLSETQQETVQNSNSSAQQDVMILYKEEVKDLKEKQNVENSFSGSNECLTEIVVQSSYGIGNFRVARDMELGVRSQTHPNFIRILLGTR
ncbi:hypothetical protein Tco_0015895 [Tanacetum coccineum]